MELPRLCDLARGKIVHNEGSPSCLCDACNRQFSEAIDLVIRTVTHTTDNSHENRDGENEIPESSNFVETNKQTMVKM